MSDAQESSPPPEDQSPPAANVLAYLGNLAGDRLVDLMPADARLGADDHVGFTMGRLAWRADTLDPATVIWIPYPKLDQESYSQPENQSPPANVLAYLGNLAGDKLADLLPADASLGADGQIGFALDRLTERAGALGRNAVIWIPYSKLNIELPEPEEIPVSYFANGRLALDPETGQFSLDGAVIEQRPKVHAALTLLVKRRGQLVTQERFRKEVWSNSHLMKNNLEWHISCIRAQLGDLRWTIQTRRGIGYTFDDSPEKDPANQKQG